MHRKTHPKEHAPERATSANITKKADFHNGKSAEKRMPDNYFDSSDRAVLALSAAAPAVTFWNASIACAFISLAL